MRKHRQRLRRLGVKRGDGGLGLQSRGGARMAELGVSRVCLLELAGRRSWLSEAVGGGCPLRKRRGGRRREGRDVRGQQRPGWFEALRCGVWVRGV